MTQAARSRRRARAMPKDLPGEGILRALMDVVQARKNPEPEVRAAVDALGVRARDAKAERQFLHKLPETVKGALCGPLEAVEDVCRGFGEVLKIYVLEWPPRFPPPPDVLITAMAAAVVSAEFRVACARANIDQKEDDRGNCVH